MLYVVAYDVSDDEIRARLSQALLRFGERVQESVFECRLTKKQLDRLVKQAAPHLRRDPTAQMRVYQVCQTCERSAFGIGRIERARSGSAAIVV